MKKDILLRDFVYRTLIKRIVIAAMIISLLLVAMLLLIERNDNRNQIQYLAHEGVAMVNQLIIDQLDGVTDEPVQSIVNKFSALQIRQSEGGFAYYEIYNEKSEIIASVEKSEYPDLAELKPIIDKRVRKTDVSALPIFKRHKFNNRYYAGVVYPLYDSNQRVKLFIAGLYAVSESEIDKLQNKLLRSIVIVISIVLLTSLLLYPVITSLTKRLANFSSELLNANLDMLETLGGAIAKRDSDTNAHNYRVTIISVRLAEKIGLSSRQIQGLIKGAFLHDIGKIGIRDNILLKPGKLEDEEFLIMKKHVDHGTDIVKNSDWLNDAIEVVASHHEKCDGSGYPEGKVRNEIPVNARIFAIADVFDALTSRRPYKEPFSFDKTMSIMRESKGSHFDAEYIEVFEQIAEDLYAHLSGREDEGLRQEVLGMTQKYFLSGLDVLKI